MSKNSVLQKIKSLKAKTNWLYLLLFFNIIWSVLSAYADFNWLSQVPYYLILFTSICSLYPPLLVIWDLIYIHIKKVPIWFTELLFVGLFTYGIAAQIYFPLLMLWHGFNWHDFGSMFWVAAYGLQAFVIKSEIKNLSWKKILPTILFFTSVDITHYFYPTFLDYTLPGYPLALKYFSAFLVVTLQISAIIITLRLSQKNTIH